MSSKKKLALLYEHSLKKKRFESLTFDGTCLVETKKICYTFNVRVTYTLTTLN